MAKKEINFKPIGVAKNSEKEPRFGSFASLVSEIIVDEGFTDALNGIEDYSARARRPRSPAIKGGALNFIPKPKQALHGSPANVWFGWTATPTRCAKMSVKEMVQKVSGGEL